MDRQKLFDFFEQEHDITLLQGQMDDIVRAVLDARWVPKYKDKPDHMEPVLITDGEEVGRGFCVHFEDGHPQWIAGNTRVDPREITHWQPYPNPPNDD